MHLFFLGLYTFVILFSFRKPPRPSIYEIILLCWIGVIIVDEIRQVSNNPFHSIARRSLRRKKVRKNGDDAKRVHSATSVLMVIEIPVYSFTKS